ncbi:MAG TPA: O-antigen ligase family protein [Solirubrobacteraceae bacterium]
MKPLLGRLELLAWPVLLAPLGALAILLADRTNPIAPLAVVGGVGLLALAWARPLLALLVGIGLVPLEVFSIPLGAIALSPAELVFVLTGVVWGARQLVEGRRPWAASPLSVPLLAVWATSIPGILAARDPGGVVRFVVIWGAFLLVFLLIVCEADARWVRTLLFTLAIVGAIVGALAVVTSAGQQEISSTGDVATGRAQGAFGSPNLLASLLALTLPAAILAAFRARPARRLLAAGAAGAVFAGLALSLSRGGLLAAAGAILVMLGWTPVRRVAIGAIAVLVLITALNANPFADVQEVQVVRERVESVRFQSASRVDQRARIYSETPKMIADHWLTGVGANNYPEFAPQYGIVEPISNDTFAHAHNIALTFAAEFGLPGLLALGWLVVAMLRAAPRLLGRHAADRGAGFAVTAAFVGFFLQGLVDFTLHSNVIAAMVFVLLGAFGVLALNARPRTADTEA